MPVGDLAPEIAVLLAAAAALLFASFAPQRMQSGAAGIALAGLAVAAFLCARQTGEDRLTFSGVWALDDLSGRARLLILGTAAFCAAMAPGWLAADRRQGEYHAMLLFATLGAMALASAADLMEVVMGALLASASGYALAAWHRDWGPSVEAGMKYFLVGALANTALVIGAVLMLGMLGGPGFAAMETAPRAGEPLTLLGLGLVVAGLAFKLGAFPAHVWMPDVAEGAPVPSAAFLMIAPKIGAAAALLRLVEAYPQDTGLRLLIALLAAATMTLGNLAALGQEDVRRLIGWSSVSQSGYALMAVAAAGTAAAGPALMLFLAAYAAGTLTAFAVVAHLRGRTARADWLGLARARPWAVAAMTLAFLSLVGIPPLAGFAGKLGLFAVTLEAGLGWLAVLAAINTALSLAYYLRVIGPAVLSPAPAQPAHALGRVPAALAGIGAAAILAAGVGAQLLLD